MLTRDGLHPGKAVKKLNPDFVISVGDLIEGYWNSEEEAHREWDGIDGSILELGIPFFQAIGNHDCGSELMLNVWRSRYGPDYYASRYGNALFLVMNTEDPPVDVPERHIAVLRELEALAKRDPLRAEEEIQAFMERISEESYERPFLETPVSRIGGRQFDFIRTVLQNNEDADWTFVVMHRPLWKTDDSGYARLEDLLIRRNCTVVAGHLHNLEITKVRGIDRIQMGRTGACKHRVDIDDFHHLLHVSIQNGKPVIKTIRLDE